MRTPQPWVWRKRRSILTLVFIIGTAAVIVGPTQAVSGLVGRSIDWLFPSEAPNAGESHAQIKTPKTPSDPSKSRMEFNSLAGATARVEVVFGNADGVATSPDAPASSAIVGSTASTASAPGITSGRGGAGRSSRRHSGFGSAGGSGGFGGGSGLAAAAGGLMSLEPALQDGASQDVGLLGMDDIDIDNIGTLLVQDLAVSAPDGSLPSVTQDSSEARASNSAPHSPGDGGSPSNNGTQSSPSPDPTQPDVSSTGTPGGFGDVGDVPAQGEAPGGSTGSGPGVGGDTPNLDSPPADPAGELTARKAEADVFAVPEPSSIALLVFGLGAGIVRRYRR